MVIGFSTSTPHEKRSHAPGVEHGADRRPDRQSAEVVHPPERCERERDLRRVGAGGGALTQAAGRAAGRAGALDSAAARARDVALGTSQAGGGAATAEAAHVTAASGRAGELAAAADAGHVAAVGGITVDLAAAAEAVERAARGAVAGDLAAAAEAIEGAWLSRGARTARAAGL